MYHRAQTTHHRMIQRLIDHRFPMVATCLLVAVLGIYFLNSSKAATIATASEAENGTVSGSTTNVTDSNASGGHAVKFGTYSAPAWACVTSDMDSSSFNANCPLGFGNFYTNYAGITDNGSPNNGRDNLNVSQNVWGAGGTDYTQTLYANSPGDWKIVSNVTNNTSGAVLTFPAAGWYPATNLVDSYKSITSSWNVTMPTADGITVGWAAYDLWFNGWDDEVMIQAYVDENSDYDCTVVDTLTLSGITWNMCEFGGERVWRPGSSFGHLTNQAVGSVDVLAIIKHMETDNSEPDKLPVNSTMYAMSFGFEVCHTNGPQTFQVNNFTWNAVQ